jgi:hypothetical protein
MLNIEEITIRSTRITEMPSYAFKPIVVHQNKLRGIWIDFGVVEKIGNYLFYGLNSLTISFHVNKLVSIPKNAFHLEKPSNETLVLWLSQNRFRVGFRSRVFRKLKKTNKSSFKSYFYYLFGRKYIFAFSSVK